jgi:hypothetical protein
VSALGDFGTCSEFHTRNCGDDRPDRAGGGEVGTRSTLGPPCEIALALLHLHCCSTRRQELPCSFCSLFFSSTFVRTPGTPAIRAAFPAPTPRRHDPYTESYAATRPSALTPANSPISESRTHTQQRQHDLGVASFIGLALSISELAIEASAVATRRCLTPAAPPDSATIVRMSSVDKKTTKTIALYRPGASFAAHRWARFVGVELCTSQPASGLSAANGDGETRQICVFGQAHDERQ